MSSSRLFFLIGSIFIPLLFGVLIPVILKQSFKTTPFLIGLGFLLASTLPKKPRDSLFYPINQLAMLIGHINQTLILGIIFYGMFMPISIFRKIRGIDTMGIKPQHTDSFWRNPDENWINFNRPY